MFIVGCNADINGPLGLTKVGFSTSNNESGLISELKFGARAVTGSFDAEIFVINYGKAEISEMVFTNPSTPFSYKGGLFPGIGGDCSLLVPKEGSCKLVLNYSPTTFTTQTSSISLSYKETGGIENTIELPISGTGTTPALLSLSEAPSYDFGLIPPGGQVRHTFIVSNSGGALAEDILANISTANFTFADGNYPGTGGSCQNILVGGASCQIVIDFAPQGVGVFGDTLIINYDNGLSPQSVSVGLQGTGVSEANLIISETDPYDYGSRVLLSDTPHTFTVFNTGGFPASPITITAFSPDFSFTGGAYPGVGGDCGPFISAGASCDIVVSFSPISLGIKTDVIEINYFSGVSNKTVARNLTAESRPPGLVVISESDPYQYGLIATGAVVAHTFVLTNTGGSPVTAISGALGGVPFGFSGGSFPGTGGNCPATLAVGVSCDVVVSFSPVALGSFSDVLTINYDDGIGATTAVRQVEGVGAPPAVISVAGPDPFDYGQRALTSTTRETFVLTNNGGVAASALSGTGVVLPFEFDGGLYPGTSGTCGLTLASGASCEVVVSFGPTTLATFSDDFIINYNDGAGLSSYTHGVIGEGVNPAVITIDQAPFYDYGTQAVGSSTTATFTISNGGQATATGISEVSLASPFVFEGGAFPGTTGTCSTNLISGNTCDLVIAFSPLTTGPKTDDIQIDYNNGANLQNVVRTVQGFAAAPGQLLVSDGPIYNFGNVPVGSNNSHTFTLTNIGGFAISGLGGGGLALPFNFTGGAFPGAGGDCISTLAPAATCEVEVSVVPLTTGVLTDTIEFTYFDGANPQVEPRDLLATSVNPANLIISEAEPFSFGLQATGSVTVHTFVVTNTGDVDATALSETTLAAPFAYVGGGYPGTNGTCGVVLAPLATCDLEIEYAPVATGNFTGQIQMDYFNGVSTVFAVRGVNGDAAPPAQLTITNSPSFTFANTAVGGTRNNIFTVTNAGGVAATGIIASGLIDPLNFTGGAFPGTAGNCSNTLAAGSTCDLDISFSPTTTGLQNDQLFLDYQDGATGQQLIQDLDGTGIAPALINITEAEPYDFGQAPLALETTHTFTVTNVGGADAELTTGTGLSAPFLFTGGAYPGTTGTCTATISNGSPCEIVVSFLPTTVGTFSGQIDINYFNGASNQTSSRGVAGEGVTPAILSITEAPIFNFGNVAVAGSKSHTFTINNTGSWPASSIIESGLGVPYGYLGGAYPGVGGDCGLPIAAGASCDIVIEFSPTVTGVAVDTIEVSYFDGVSTQNVNRDVQGVGATPALINISEVEPFDYGTLPTGATVDHTFVLTNSGGTDATLMNSIPLTLPYSFAGGSYPGAGGDCTTTLVSLNTCNLVVSFNPTVVGASSDLIQINYSDGVSPVNATRGLQGNAVPPGLLAISESDPYDFGSIVAGTSTNHIFTVTNSGGFPVNSIIESGLITPFGYSGGSYPGTAGNCAGILAPAASCDLDIEFAPVVLGLQSSTITIDYNDGAAARQVTRDIQGTGLAPANLIISDLNPFDFGVTTVGVMNLKTFVITNSGLADATAVSGLGLTPPYDFEGGGGFPGATGTCTTTILAGASCDVVVGFTPTVLGVQTDTLSINYNDGVSPQSLDKDLSGEGITPANITISDASLYDFGVVADGSSHQHTFTLTNSGASPALTVAGAALSLPYTYFGGGGFPGTGGTCTATLNAGANCDVVVSFDPTATGIQLETLAINYNDSAAAQTSTRNIQGTVVTPAAITISESDPFNYGTIAVGGTFDHTFVLTNTGQFEATSVAGVALTLPFSFTGGTFPGLGGDCTTNLLPAATCNVVINFSPSAALLSTDNFQINYYDGANGQNEIRSIEGTGDLPANLTISDGPTFDFGTIANGTVIEHTFVVTNNGNIQATALADGSGLNLPFRYKGGAYPGTLGTCATTLSSLATCELVVEFAPSLLGVQTDTIELNYFDGAANVNSNRDLTAEAIDPAVLTLSDGPIFDYNLQANGSQTNYIFTITNGGGTAATAIADALALTAPFEFSGGVFPGAGGNCASTLLPAATCNVEVSFSPSVTGTFSDTIEINYNDGLVAQVVTRDVTGASAAPALITITDFPSYDFGGVVVNSSQTRTFTLANTGGIEATGLNDNGLVAAPYTYEGGSYPGTTGTCATNLLAGSSCDVVVVFSPITTGAHTASIDLDYDDGATNISLVLGLQGSGLSPANLTLSEINPYDYGQVTSLSTRLHTFILTNAGGGSASSISGSGLTAPFDFQGGTFPGVSGTCVGTLAPTASCEVVVEFAPTATGIFTDTIDVNYNDGAIFQTVSRDVTGEGLLPAVLTITESDPFDYGVVANNGSRLHTFTVSNSGASSATSIAEVGLVPPFAFAGGAYPGTGGDCSTVLASTLSCEIVVEFAPTVLGAYNDTIELNFNDGAAAQTLTRAVQGISGAPALLTISDGPTYNYGTQSIGSSTAQTFTISNSGAVPASLITDLGTLALPFTYEGAGYPGTTGTCGTSLANGATCEIVVNFEPSSAGSFTGTIDINYNDGVTTHNTQRDLAGTSAAPAVLAITESDPYDYSSVTVGGSSSHVFTLSNSGGVAATSINEIGLALPFQFVGGTFPGAAGTCTTSLSAGGNCDVEIEFAPTSTGFATDTIEFNYNNGTSIASVTRVVQGTGLAPAVLAISEGPASYDYGTVPTGSTNRHTFTVTNTGGSPATAIAGAGLAFPYTFEGGAFPGATGTCGTSILAGATCDMVVDYTPSAVTVGSDDDSIEINYNDGVTGQLSSRDVTGIAVAPANLTISESDPYNYGTLATGSAAVHTFIVTNSGTFQASSLAEVGLVAPFSFVGGSYPGTNGTCSTTLSGGGTTCELEIQYSPSVVSALDVNTITLNYSDGVNGQSSLRSIQGVAVSPASITISESDPYDYGTIADGSTASHVFTLTNGGGFTASSLLETGLVSSFQFNGGSFPGTAGTCTTSMAPGSSCDIDIEFIPSSTGFFSETITISYNNGATSVSSSRVVQGTSAAPAFITITETNPYDYGNITQGASTLHTFTLQNTGAVDALGLGGAGLTAPYSFEGGSFPGASGDCTAILNPSATCEIVVVFAPTSLGVLTDTIEINYNDGASAQTSLRDVSGTGITPAMISISESEPYNFGVVANNGTIFHTFVLTNSGASVATGLSEVALAPPFAFRGGGFPGTGGDCATSLAGSSTTCDIVVEFAPTVLGSYSGTIDISYNDGVVVQNSTRGIQGTSGAPALLTLSDAATFNYGNQSIGSTSEHTFTISNSGAVDALAMSETSGALASPFSYKGGGGYPGVGGDCTTSLASSASCTIVVLFEPTGAGTFTDTISIDYNDGSTGQTTVRDVAGDASPPANITITESDPYDYLSVTVGASRAHTFTLNNSGGVAASSISEIGLSLPFQFVGGAFPGGSGTCTTLLSAGSSCDVEIEFAPTATGFVTGSINFSYYNGTSTANTIRTIQGTGLAPAVLAISEGPASYDYGTVPTGSTNRHTFTVTNTGGSPATAIAGAGLAFPYTFEGGAFPGATGTCGTSILAGATCDMVVDYTPSAVTVGSDDDSIEINYNDGVTGQLSSRDVTGIAVAPANLTISESDPYNYGTLATGSAAVHTFIVTNSGTFQASSLAEVGLVAPFSFVGGSYPGTNGTCSTTLSGGGTTCELEIQYSPSVVSALDVNTITLNYSDGVNGQSSLRSIQGVAVSPASITISESDPYDYGTIADGSTASHVFTLTNGGGFTASSLLETGLVSSFQFNGGSFPGTAGTCTTSMAPGSSCDIDIEFIPSSTGFFSETITISYNNGATSVSSSRVVQGTSAAPAFITITETNPYDYGNVTQGGSDLHTFTLQNTGAVSALGMGGGGLSAPYTFAGGAYPGATGTCSGSLIPAATCEIVVSFAPTSLGVLTDTIEINYNDGASAQTSLRDLTGTGITPALITISESEPYDFGLIANNGNSFHTFVLTNSGASNASSISEMALVPPFTFRGGGFPGTGGNCATTLAGGGNHL